MSLTGIENPESQGTYLIHDSSLLLERHLNGILMAVAVQADLVARVGNHPALFGKRLEGVAGDEPRRFDVVPLEHGEQAAHADRAGEETWATFVSDEWWDWGEKFPRGLVFYECHGLARGHWFDLISFWGRLTA